MSRGSTSVNASPIGLQRGAPRSLFEPPRYLSRADAEALAKRVLSFATADETRIVINSEAQMGSRFAVNQMTTANDNTDVTVSIRSSYGKRSGTATTNALDDASLKRAVETSEHLAKLAPEDPEAMPELGPQQYLEPKGWSDVTAGMEPAVRAAMVNKVTEPSRTAGLVSTGYLEGRAGSTAVATSKGLFAYAPQTESVLTTTVRYADGTGSGWGGAAHWDASQLHPEVLGARAIEKAKLSRNPVAIEPGRYTVILEPTAVGNLVQLVMFAMSARNADEGRSFFTKPGGGNKIGMKVVDERVSLTSDPHDPDTYTNTFTLEGLPGKRIEWIKDGVVQNLMYDRFWAQKTGHEANSSGGGGFFGGGGGLVGGLKMSGGDASLDDLIKSTDRGLLVTRFWYIRPVDPRTILYTGLTRDGTFLIEKGKITRAVKNLRFNESPIFMLNNLDAMGRPIRVSASEGGGPGLPIVVPPIKVHDFTFSSISDAI